MSDDTLITDDELEQVDETEFDNSLAQLQADLQLSRAREQRLMADYQNLIRRNREEQSRWAKLATKDFVSELLLPLEHLMRASEQVQDAGLSMVVQQFWQTLERHGVQRIETIGQEFDVATMEAVEQVDDSLTVLSEVRPGFKLNGEVIQHAKVLLGNSVKKDKKN